MDLNQNEVTNTNVNTNKKVRKTKKNNKIKRLIVIIIILLILLVSSIAMYKYLSKDKLSYYENKMIEYGLADKYNNNTPNDEENVTKSEAVKMILEAMLINSDISNYVELYGNEFYTNFTWVQYAMRIRIIEFDFITDVNEAENITYIDAIKILYNLKQKNYISMDNINKVLEESDIKIKNKDEYSEEEIKVITDLISYGIIDNNYSYKKEEILTKKQLNKMLVNFMEKFNLITKE